LEEGPWLDEAVREEIGSKVVEGAKAVGYCGLATFEFLRDSKGEFYFLEVNPRVQVEHTVTEMITGTDLVSMGIRVAYGEKIRMKQEDVMINGHAIQVRLNAENPVTLTPSPGKLWECHWPGGPGVRVDTHAYTGYDMPASFDSLLAKLIVWAPSREESIAKLKAALSEIKLLGVDTLIPLHQAILSESDFRKRNITIHYLEEHKNLL
jgi:biotin carboxylase